MIIRDLEDFVVSQVPGKVYGALKNMADQTKDLDYKFILKAWVSLIETASYSIPPVVGTFFSNGEMDRTFLMASALSYLPFGAIRAWAYREIIGRHD